jgi:hypothetical protein
VLLAAEAARFLASVVVAALVALALHLSATVRRAVYPLLVASQTIPIVVVAPILVVVLGFDLAPKLAIVGLICFFPIVVSSVDGLQSVDPSLRDMMRSFYGTRWSTLRRVEIPAALPAAFSGARIAATYATIGAAPLRQATGAATGETPSFHAPGRTAAGGGCAAEMRPPQFRGLTAEDDLAARPPSRRRCCDAWSTCPECRDRRWTG